MQQRTRRSQESSNRRGCGTWTFAYAASRGSAHHAASDPFAGRPPHARLEYCIVVVQATAASLRNVDLPTPWRHLFFGSVVLGGIKKMSPGYVLSCRLFVIFDFFFSCLVTLLLFFVAFIFFIFYFSSPLFSVGAPLISPFSLLAHARPQLFGVQST